MRIVCMSDTHCLQHNFKVPEGDLIIHAGDFSSIGTDREVRKFAKWFRGLPHPHKVVIAGNHDRFFERQPEIARSYLEPDIIYLEDSGCEIGGLKFWGSPWQPEFERWAFNLPRNGVKLLEKWAMIPADTDVLITHGPPSGVLDQVRPRITAWGMPEDGSGPLGCEQLAARVACVRPKLHVFGHIHDGYGQITQDGTTFVNASVCDEDYRPMNRPIVVEL